MEPPTLADSAEHRYYLATGRFGCDCDGDCTCVDDTAAWYASLDLAEAIDDEADPGEES